MSEVAAEVETKLDVAPDFVAGDLSAFGPVADDVVSLSSTYYDTPDRALFRHHLTLRRRDGDDDTGWHLKVPAAEGRTEIRLPSGEDLPAELLDLLAPFLRGVTPSPSVRLDVTRSRHRIGDPLIAEVAHDNVRAVALGSPVRAPRWHEVEVELGPAGTPQDVANIVATLIRRGAIASTSRSKLSRALLGIGNEGVGPRSSAGAVLLDYLGTQSDAMVAGYFAIQRDEAESIHQTRVASRRIRSTLRTFEYCFDGEQAVRFEDELKWFASVLGEVRDREVLRQRLAAAIADLPADLVVGPVADQIDAQLADELREARARVLAMMRSDRYAELLVEVTRWRDDPPFTALAGRPASTLHEAVESIERKLAKRLSSAATPSGSDADMHQARKTGKRARYAAEAVAVPVDNRHKALQDLLGEFQDSVVATELLLRLAADARERGEDGFTYGVLVAGEHRRAQRAKRRARKRG